MQPVVGGRHPPGIPRAGGNGEPGSGRTWWWRHRQFRALRISRCNDVEARPRWSSVRRARIRTWPSTNVTHAPTMFSPSGNSRYRDPQQHPLSDPTSSECSATAESSPASLTTRPWGSGVMSASSPWPLTKPGRPHAPDCHGVHDHHSVRRKRSTIRDHRPRSCSHLHPSFFGPDDDVNQFRAVSDGWATERSYGPERTAQFDCSRRFDDRPTRRPIGLSHCRRCGRGRSCVRRRGPRSQATRSSTRTRARTASTRSPNGWNSRRRPVVAVALMSNISRAEFGRAADRPRRLVTRTSSRPARAHVPETRALVMVRRGCEGDLN
jgi:hypothetical protein